MAVIEAVDEPVPGVRRPAADSGLGRAEVFVGQVGMATRVPRPVLTAGHHG